MRHRRVRASLADPSRLLELSAGAGTRRLPGWIRAHRPVVSAQLQWIKPIVPRWPLGESFNRVGEHCVATH